ncbi:aminotransferase class I/II-fold pyridoxal phosphate-dependent enzyme [Gammaproteobacteria bacterium]|nr:aminotransferase class I/II-fold pyridoxal phosphate-dependent enzyme [Gammaproteobacteria bacterium]
MSNKRIADQDPLSKVNPFRVMTVMARAQYLESQGRQIVHMEVGEPDFSSAQPIIDAGKRALDDGLTQYTAASGLAELRECLSVHYRENYNVEVDANRILITPGASGGLNLLANLLVRAGDGVLLSDPAYPCVRNFIHMMSAQPQLIPVGIEQNFQPTLEQLDEYCTDKTSGLWLASPSNPTGTILERSKLKAACNWATSRQKHLLVDEIYHGLHYVDDLPSVLELDQSAFVVNSFSKYFGMTGWRLGWIVVPQEHVEMANILAQNMYISASSISQYAALAAFTPEAKRIFEERREAFRHRRDFLTEALKSMGFLLCDNIQGAFYVYVDISKFSDDCEKFCHDMLEDHGVALTPGTDFGDFESKSHVRMAFTTDMDSLELGLQRLQNALL